MSRSVEIPIALMLAGAICLGAPSAWVGPPPPGAVYPEGEDELQFKSLERDLQQRAHFERMADQTFRREALIWQTDRDPLDVILRRTETLLADIRRMDKVPDLSEAAEALAGLRISASQTTVTNAPALFPKRFTGHQEGRSWGLCFTF